MGMAAGAGGLWAANAFIGATPQHAEKLQGEIERGRILVTVAAGEKGATARTILERNGGHARFDTI